MDNVNIPLQRMEELEEKYGVELFVNQYEDNHKPDEYFMKLASVYLSPPFEHVKFREFYEYLGSTLDDVERELERRYGNKNI